MKIAFWSSARGNVGTTSNMACISVMAALGYSYKALLFENHYQRNDIGSIMKYHHSYLLNSKKHFPLKALGMDYLMNKISYFQFLKVIKSQYSYSFDNNQSFVLNDPRNELQIGYYNNVTSLIKEAAVEVVENYLFYLPTTAVIPQNIYDISMCDHVTSILSGAEALADIVYVDTSKENYLSSKIILNEVDLVVVNLYQDMEMLKSFFVNYQSLIKKSFILISNYNPNSNLTIDKISTTFSYPKSQIAGIPYNEEYEEALMRGTLVEFLSRNIDCDKREEVFPFIQEVLKAVTLILTRLFKIKKGE